MNFIRNLIRAFTSELNLIIHDGGVMIFIILLPLVYPVLYSLIYNPEYARDVKVVVVDNDRTPLSRELIHKLDACQEIKITGYASDINEAKQAMDSRECFAIIEIPDDFQRMIGRGEQATAVFYSDMSLLIRYKAVLTATTNVALSMGSELQAMKTDEIAPLASTLISGDPMPVESRYLGNVTGGFASFLMPGVLILILQQSIVLAVGMAGGTRREKRLYGEAKEITFAAWYAGRIFCYIILFIIPAIYICHYVPLMFSLPMNGNVFEILVFIVPLIIASVMIGFCLQGVVSERESVFVIWVITSIIFLFLSGLTWPHYAMPRVWQLLSDCIPATHGVSGFVRINSNGASLWQVGPSYMSLWVQTAVYGVISIFVQRRLRNKFQ